MSLKPKKPRRATHIDLGWALHRGLIDDAKLHAHDALQISFARKKKRLGIDLGEAMIWASTALIHRGIRHSVHSPFGTPSTLFLDPDSEAARGLAAMANGRSVVRLAGKIEIAARKLVQGRFDDDESMRRSYDEFSSLFGAALKERPSDPRVQAALATLVEGHRRKWPLAGLAEAAGLSIPQFAHLFQKCTGLPVRTHVRWLRFQTAIRSLAHDGDLTSAAADAGYLNALQFTHAFRRVFGISPSVFAETLQREALPDHSAPHSERARVGHS